VVLLAVLALSASLVVVAQITSKQLAELDDRVQTAVAKAGIKNIAVRYVQSLVHTFLHHSCFSAEFHSFSMLFAE